MTRTASDWLYFPGHTIRDGNGTIFMASPLDEALSARLSSAPAQTLAVAMIFEAAIWAHRGSTWTSEISREALICAITHVDECLKAADWLDSLVHRASTEQNAEVLFESIMRDFATHRHGPTIYATRSDLTRAYCHNSMRRGSLQPRDLYDRLIPVLIRQGKAMLAVREGKKEVYAFRVEG